MDEHTNTALVISDETRAIQHAANEVLSMKYNVFQKGVHYGEPFKGSGKATLLKPGAEMLMSRFGLWPNFIERGCVEDFDKPLFHYRYECRLMRVDTGEVAGAGIGSCNSMEDKYRWRKADRLCPDCHEPKIIKSKYPDRRTGDVGWYCLACKTSYHSTDPGIINQETGRIPNEDIYSLVNTLDKMAQKRALIAAILVATGASAWFTQDVEDFAGYEGVVVDADDASTGEVDTPRAVDNDTGEVTRVVSAPRKPARKSAPAEPAAESALPPVSSNGASDDDAPLRGAAIAPFVEWVMAVSDVENKHHAGARALKALGAENWQEVGQSGTTIAAAREAVEAYNAAKHDAAQTEMPLDVDSKREHVSESDVPRK